MTHRGHLSPTTGCFPLFFGQLWECPVLKTWLTPLKVQFLCDRLGLEFALDMFWCKPICNYTSGTWIRRGAVSRSVSTPSGECQRRCCPWSPHPELPASRYFQQTASTMRSWIQWRTLCGCRGPWNIELLEPEKPKFLCSIQRSCLSKYPIHELQHRYHTYTKYTNNIQQQSTDFGQILVSWTIQLEVSHDLGAPVLIPVIRPWRHGRSGEDALGLLLEWWILRPGKWMIWR